MREDFDRADFLYLSEDPGWDGGVCLTLFGEGIEGAFDLHVAVGEPLCACECHGVRASHRGAFVCYRFRLP